MLERLYEYLPVPIQNTAVSVYGYYWRKRRFGGIFKRELRRFKERENFSKQAWRDYQTCRLRELLIHAYETVPFYREKYQRHGINLSLLRKFEIEDLPKLPYLTKSDLRKFGTSTLLSKKREKGGRYYQSSGSTGTPTQILFSLPFHQRWMAAFESRVRHWAGVDSFQSRGMIGGRKVVPRAVATPPYYRYNFFEKQVYFSAYHIAPSTILNYLEAMIRYSVVYMTGYAMSNFFLASLFKERNIETPKLKAVITSSERLTDEMRQLFKEVYRCKTFDSYSGIEACGLISETQYGDLLISPDVGIMEILKPDGNLALPGEEGEVVSTGFLNFDQPLIRYRIGDVVKLRKEQKTHCGREMPVVEKIEGRIEDVVVGLDGRRMVRFHSLYVGLPGIVAAQIIQEDYDCFSFNIVKDDSFDVKNELIIVNRLERQLGRVKVSFHYLNSLPKNANGKFQAVISKIRK